MFAVPGWSVSSDSLKIEKHQKPSSNKKRKRSARDDEPIDASQIGDLWKKHVEGKADDEQEQAATDPHTLTKKEKKKLKRDSVAHTDTTTTDTQVGIEIKNTKSQVGRKTERAQSNPQDTTLEDIPENTNQISKSPKNKDEQRKQSRKKDKQTPVEHNHAVAAPDKPSHSEAITAISTKPAMKLTPLQASMRQKLISSRFRHLNETLYTTPSASSLELFKTNPEFFSEYHEGFRRQVEAWPENPLDSFLRWINERGPIGLRNYKEIRRKTSRKPIANTKVDVEPGALSEAESLPRDPRKGICTLADLGCGDGKLGLEITRSGLLKKLRLNVHSYDLVSAAPHIQVADIRSLPLEDSSVDITIFCLALMGTNWIEFIEEAYRVLRWKGECWIAEVTSRFATPKSSRVEHSVGNKVKNKQKKKSSKQSSNLEPNEDDPEELGLVDDAQAAPQNTTDVSAFVDVLRRRGFALQGTPYTGNRMFVLMRFVKALPPRKGKGTKAEKLGGKKKFIEDGNENDISIEDEAKVLKPCVYKIR